ncbi:hypothetical protein T440DRAFT_422609 [Plenodomus tracheiphilus IPT5]|uniref:Uncharacterized protein n=1 Tax=Plenodomus tracheiphilus IPT5 TaxID=1408161 RepID=A0A6A7B8Z8_9PLEO|nr:hypothetical protein T440DRAFT_422609 [Plenodomus tracheiphilus IPT5]
MSKQGTVVEQKQLFIQSRKHFLSRGITPSERLLRIANDNGIELSVLKGVIDKVNRNLKQHSRKVYSRQMIEHVVEQIDILYWEAGARSTQSDEDDEETDPDLDADEEAKTLYQSDDLTLDTNIAKLPAAFPPSSSSTAEISQDDYLASLTRLQDLSAQRQTLQNRLTMYRTLLTLLEPYRQPKENIQPNLVWKDAPLAPELAKMRTLAIRVAGRVGERFGNVQVPATAEEEDGDIDMGGLEERKGKVERVLASW